MSINIDGLENFHLQNIIGRDLIFFRNSMASKLSRNVVIRPNVKQEPDLNIHLINSILSQNHLSPINPVV